jgi:glycosyltransferase involved in cell wall biosynthesis
MTARAPFTAAVCGPLPPTRNGIADYTSELLGPLHGALGGVAAVIAAGAPAPLLSAEAAGAQILRAPSFDALMAGPQGASIMPIYQVGNNPDHVFLLPRLARHPGVLVLHDATLNYLLLHATTELGRPGAFSDLYGMDQGPRGLRLYRDQWEAGLGGQGLPKELALAGPLIERSRAIIVHSEYSARRARQACPETPVFVAPHHVSPAITAATWRTRAAARERLMLPVDDFIALSIGFATPAKQIGPAIAAVGKAKPAHQSATFVVAGAHDLRAYDLAPFIEQSGLQGKVLLRGYVPEAAFADYLAAADLVFNLRHPYGGETSGTLARALGMGAACVVTDVGAFSELPDDVVMKVPYGQPYDQALAQAIAPLFADPDRLRGLKQSALRFARKAWTVEKTVSAYAEAVGAAREAAPRTRHCALVRAETPAATAQRAKDVRPELLTLLAETGGLRWPAERASPRVAVASVDEKTGRDLTQALCPTGEATRLDVTIPTAWRGDFDAVALAINAEDARPATLAPALAKLLGLEGEAIILIFAAQAETTASAAEALECAAEEFGFLSVSDPRTSENAACTSAVVSMRWRRISTLTGWRT